MSEVKHTKLPWRVEEDTDLIWGACNEDDQTNYGMGYPIASGFTSFGAWAKGRPEFPEKEANAAFIVRACNSHYELLEALKAALKFINSHAADPDITSEMRVNWSALQALDPDAIVARAEGRE